jgi:hypothetical protein
MRLCLQQFVVSLVIVAPNVVAIAQSTSPAPASTPLGTGPRVEIQVGPNGTLDVGGARGSDVNLTGENLRGSFGASWPQTGLNFNPVGPSPVLPAPTARPLFSPGFDFGAAGGAGGNLDSAATNQAEINDLILPRFRADLSGASRQSGGQENWRYKHSSGRWWYWRPNQSWLYWDGAEWRPFVSR